MKAILVGLPRLFISSSILITIGIVVFQSLFLATASIVSCPFHLKEALSQGTIFGTFPLVMIKLLRPSRWWSLSCFTAFGSPPCFFWIKKRPYLIFGFISKIRYGRSCVVPPYFRSRLRPLIHAPLISETHVCSVTGTSRQRLLRSNNRPFTFTAPRRKHLFTAFVEILKWRYRRLPYTYTSASVLNWCCEKLYHTPASLSTMGYYPCLY